MNAIAFAFNNAASAQENGIRAGGKKYVFSKIADLSNVPVLHCAKVMIDILVGSITLYRIISMGANSALLREYRARKELLLPNVDGLFW